VTGRFIPISSAFGYVLWVGNYLPLDGRDRHHISRNIVKELVPNWGTSKGDTKLVKLAIRGMIDKPLPSAWLMFRKVGRFWFDVYASVPKGTEAPRDDKLALIFTANNALLVILGFLGLLRSRNKLRKLSVPLGVMALTMLTSVITIPMARYRLPIMPFICMFAAAALFDIWQRIFGRGETDEGQIEPNVVAEPVAP